MKIFFKQLPLIFLALLFLFFLSYSFTLPSLAADGCPDENQSCPSRPDWCWSDCWSYGSASCYCFCDNGVSNTTCSCGQCDGAGNGGMGHHEVIGRVQDDQGRYWQKTGTGCGGQDSDIVNVYWDGEPLNESTWECDAGPLYKTRSLKAKPHTFTLVPPNGYECNRWTVTYPNGDLPNGSGGGCTANITTSTFEYGGTVLNWWIKPSVSPPTCTLTANPSSGTAPLSGTLNWSTTNNPTSCTASGSWSGSKNPAGGSEGYGPLSAGTYTYSLSCSNAGGTGTCNATVPVSPPTSPPPCSGDISCSPSEVTVPPECGDNSTISWSTTNAPNAQVWVYMDGGGGALMAANASGSDRPTWFCPGHYYDFKLYCNGESGLADSCRVTATSTPAQPGVQSCVCSWKTVGCGGGSCKPSQMYSVKTCKWSSY